MTESQKTLHLLSRDFAAQLAGATPPCVSLYQPTHRHHPDNEQDPIRFRNLLKPLEQSLRQAWPAAEAAALMAPLEALAHDTKFWTHTLDGLAVFSAPGLFEVFTTQRPVPELAVVADSFHTKPLRRLLQSVDRYHLLALTRHSIRLLEGDRDVLDEIELAPAVPRTITDALGDELTDPHQTVASYGGTGGGSMPMRHGSGGKSDEVDGDTERFFRAVDRAILTHHSRPSGLPLILAALPEHHAIFKGVSANPHLVPQGIMLNPEALLNAQLCSQAWALNEPEYRARLAALADRFGSARAGGLGSDDLSDIAVASHDGRVDTLLVEADRQLPGRRDGDTGRILAGDLHDPRVDDLLDDLAEEVEARGGQVLVVAADAMPVKSGVAAIYRY